MEKENDFFRILPVYVTEQDVIELMDSKILGLAHAKSADPFTWAWLGIKLAEGAVAWLGGKIIDSFFRDNGRDIFEVFKDIVRGELAQEALRRALSRLHSVEESFKDYHSAGGQDRIEHATRDITDLISEFQSLGREGHHGFITASALKVLILQERETIFRRSESENILRIATNIREFTVEVLRDWELHVRNMFSEVQTRCEMVTPPRGYLPGRDRCFAWYTFNGVSNGRIIRNDSDVNRVREERATHINKELELAKESQYVIPLQIADSLSKAASVPR